MPIKGSCLLFDTELKERLHRYVEYVAYGRAKKGVSATLGPVYALIRKAGIEVDLPTVGEVYNDVMPRDDANFSSESEIYDYVGKTWAQDISKIVEMEDLFGQVQIGEEKPERAVVEMLMRALYNDMVTDNRTVSDMKALQKALADGIKRKLGKLDGKKATKQDMVTLIEQALGWEKMGVVDLNGHLNSIEDLFNHMKRELQNATNEIRESEDENVVDRWDEYIKNLETATYQLLFRRNDARQVRDEALIKKGFGVKRGNKEVLDFNKLAAYGSISTMRRTAVDAFIDAGFTPNQATRVADTLEQEFYDLKADVVERQTQNVEKFAKGAKKLVLNNAGLNHLLAGKTMAEWVKDQNVETVEELAKKAYAELADTNYAPQVKRKAVQLLDQFFNENYARVNEVEAQKVIDDILGKGTPNEKTAIEWIKENGIQNQDELYTAIDNALAGRDISPQNNVAIRDEFNRLLDINNRAEKELKSKQEAAESYEAKKYKPTKSDLKRLVELYHLGAFESTYNKSLFRVIGVDKLVAADLDDIRSLAETASKLSRSVGNAKGYNLYNDASVATLFQTIQRDIDRIIQRNINNKSKLLKILSFISNFLNVMLSSMLAMPTTMVQNIFSGLKAVLTEFRTGATLEQTKDASKLFFAMLSDVTRTGQAYGEEIGSFATQELYLNTLRFKWGKGVTISDKARSLLLGVTMPIRIGLLAFDSANKVALANKVFYNQMKTALMKMGNYSSREANEILNEALYGKSLEDAKVLARKIAEETNANLPLHLRHKITDSYVIRLANDVVKANIITKGLLQNNETQKGILDALIKGAYHVAGISLGHEPNNILSRWIKSGRDSRRRNEEKYIKQKDWNGLVWHKATTAGINNFLVRFAGGATNWLVLRAKEGLPGVGFFYGMAGKWNSDINYLGTDKEGNKNLKEEVIAREAARSDMARNIIGVTYAMLFQLLGYSLFGGGDDDDAKKKIKQLKDLQKKKGLTEAQHKEIGLLEDKVNAYTKLRANRDKQRWFRNLAPDMQLIKYYIETAKQSGDASIAEGIVQYVTRTYAGDDRFSVTGKLKDAGVLIAQGDVDAGLGVLSSILGDRVQVPMYRAYKEYVRVVSNPFRSDPVPPPRYVPPTNLFEGFFGGGLVEDLMGKDPSITAITGIGPASYERFKKLKITHISDLKNENMLNAIDGKGTILDAKQRAQAKKWLEEYKKSN